MWTALKSEILAYTTKEKLFILCAMLCGFCITADYAIIRPVSNSLFIHNYGAHFFPFAWLATVRLNFLVVALYNRFLPLLGCRRMFLAIMLGVSGLTLCAALLLGSVPSLSFFYYIWKEVYVMLLFQQLWSVIHATIPSHRARYLYGLFYLVGAFGALLGSLCPSFLATDLGSEKVLFLALPVYGILTFLYFSMLRFSPPVDLGEKKQAPLKQSLGLIATSRTLQFILLLVVCMQMGSTLIDYQFNSALEIAYPDKDLRTAFSGKVLMGVHALTMALQAFGTFLIVQWLGIRGSHYFVPLFLALGALSCIAFPAFALIAGSFITIKAFDFSIFGVIKEMLYIPLSTDEKFRAKAVIDVFAYRTSKALASFLILLLPLTALSWGMLALFLLWIVAASFYFMKIDAQRGMV